MKRKGTKETLGQSSRDTAKIQYLKGGLIKNQVKLQNRY